MALMAGHAAYMTVGGVLASIVVVDFIADAIGGGTASDLENLSG